LPDGTVANLGGTIGRLSKLTLEQIGAAVGELAGWETGAEGESISRVFTFPDFSRAMAFMTAVAIAADKMDHHPEWSNVYRTVNVRLTTHSAHGVTNRDIELARVMNDVARGLES
jgi:4a-hydroxytetrahydrobiopterin dehydratase